jgi:pilus assembly protein CpaE
MARVLLIDDEPVFYKMIEHALKPQGYELEYARTGMDGLRNVATFNPDVIIIDVRLPDMDGFEVVQRLRRTPKFAHVPIIFLSSQVELSDKLKGFEVGADDYLTKPFQPEELIARVGLLLRRSEAMRTALPSGLNTHESTVVAVHSLRGGVGCTSMAVNLAITYRNIWEKPTLLLDADMTAGQIALMLNTSPSNTVEELASQKIDELDDHMVRNITSHHSSGIDFIAAPSSPLSEDGFDENMWPTLLERLNAMYNFIVIDLSHSFSNFSIYLLNKADTILLVLAPEMASIRVAISALSIYKKLGYSSSKIVPVINQIFSVAGIKQKQIEKVLNLPVNYVLPHAPVEFVRALNYGQPVVLSAPESDVTAIFEDIAYSTSKDSLKTIPPASPTASWKRVVQRATEKK